MPKNLTASAKTFAKNVSAHVRSVLVREETPRQAWSDIAQDARKLKHKLIKPPPESESRRKASRLLKEGRQEYNQGNYGMAEELFKRAIKADSTYALAFTFLGHARYKQGNPKDALASWQHAVKIDPNSEAASKARKKIQHVEKEVNDFTRRLEKDLRESKR